MLLIYSFSSELLAFPTTVDHLNSSRAVVFVRWPAIVAFELDLHNAKLNQYIKYIGQRSVSYIVQTDRHTRLLDPAY